MKKLIIALMLFVFSYGANAESCAGKTGFFYGLVAVETQTSPYPFNDAGELLKVGKSSGSITLLDTVIGTVPNCYCHELASGVCLPDARYSGLTLTAAGAVNIVTGNPSNAGGRIAHGKTGVFIDSTAFPVSNGTKFNELELLEPFACQDQPNGTWYYKICVDEDGV